MNSVKIEDSKASILSGFSMIYCEFSLNCCRNFFWSLHLSNFLFLNHFCPLFCYLYFWKVNNQFVKIKENKLFRSSEFRKFKNLRMVFQKIYIAKFFLLTFFADTFVFTKLPFSANEMITVRCLFFSWTDKHIDGLSHQVNNRN